VAKRRSFDLVSQRVAEMRLPPPPAPPPPDTSLVDALDAISARISGIYIPEVQIPDTKLSIDLESAVSQMLAGLQALKSEPEPVDLKPVVDALKGIAKKPQSQPVDLSPIVDAIRLLALVIERMKAPEIEIPPPAPVSFRIERDSSGRMSRVIATPQAD